jgi:hypothetical protein
MDLTARQLRTGIRSPAALGRQLRLERLVPIPVDTPRSPQRLWIEASLRRYFDGGRDPDRLLADYSDRTARSKRRDTAASEIANGRRMLERFVELDRSQPDPTRVLLKPIRAPVCGHWVTMGVDVAYQTLEGWVLRQLLTDDEIRRTEHVRWYAAATALHFEGHPDGGDVARVEVWMLRLERGVVGWPGSLLGRLTSSLATRMDEIAAGAFGQAA